MIKTETVTINNSEFTYTYSDNHCKIKQNETGEIYNLAYDIPNKYTYTETTEKVDNYDEVIEAEKEAEELEKQAETEKENETLKQALNIIRGEDE